MTLSRQTEAVQGPAISIDKGLAFLLAVWLEALTLPSPIFSLFVTIFVEILIGSKEDACIRAAPRRGYTSQRQFEGEHTMDDSFAVVAGDGRRAAAWAPPGPLERGSRLCALDGDERRDGLEATSGRKEQD